MSLAQALPSIEVTREGLQPLETSDAIRPFAAVGRLDTGVSFCTATLITPELVLTAAHCLFDSETGQRQPDENLMFHAGLSHDQVSARRGVRVSFIHPDYTFGAPSDRDRVRTDLALLRLDRLISFSDVTPISAGGILARRGDEVHVVSYGRDRERYASLEEGCDVMARQWSVAVLSCSVVSGSSGSPVMVSTPGGYRIVSVVSASAQWLQDPVALAAELEGSLDQLLILAGTRQPGIVTSGLPQVRTLAQNGDGRSTSGALFIRP